MVTTHSEEECELLVSLRNQGRSYDAAGWFHHASGRVQLPAHRHPGCARARPAGEARPDPGDAEAAAARYGELLERVDGVETPFADDADHKRSWFVYVVKLAPGSIAKR